MNKLGFLGLFVCLVGCGGESMSDASSGGAAGSAGSAGSAGTGGSGGSGGSGGAGATAGTGGSGATGGSAGAAPECVPQEQPPFEEPTCEDLWVMQVSEPKIDGVVAPGSSAGVVVRLQEVAGLGFGYYPGVSFESDHPGVSVQHDDWYYAIFACASYEASGTITVASDVPSGTEVTITARVAMLNQECPEAHSIEIPIVVQ